MSSHDPICHIHFRPLAIGGVMRCCVESLNQHNGGKIPFSTISKPSGSPRTAPKRKRTKAEKERIYGPPGYVEWCKSQVCVACRRSSRCDVAHILSGGVGRKDDWIRTVPLCSDKPYRLGCHSLLHTWGRKSFEVQWGINLEKCALQVQEQWLSFTGEK